MSANIISSRFQFSWHYRSNKSVQGIMENNNMFIYNCSRLTTERNVIWTKSLTDKTGKKKVCVTARINLYWTLQICLPKWTSDSTRLGLFRLHLGTCNYQQEQASYFQYRLLPLLSKHCICYMAYMLRITDNHTSDAYTQFSVAFRTLLHDIFVCIILFSHN